LSNHTIRCQDSRGESSEVGGRVCHWRMRACGWVGDLWCVRNKDLRVVQRQAKVGGIQPEPAAVKRLLLHIGSPKTGSSSIQATCFEAQAKGGLGQVAYMPANAFGTEVPCGYVSTLYREFDQLPRGFRSRYRDDREALAADAMEYGRIFHERLGGEGDLILSSEYLYSFGRENIRAFAADLERHGVDEVRVLVYVRDPASMYLSAIQQQLRAAHRFPCPERYKYGFRWAIEGWEEVFPGRVRVRPFERDQLVEGCVVRDFFFVAGELFGNDFRGVDVVRRNESLSSEAVYLLQRYRQEFHPDADDVFLPDSDLILTELAGVQSKVMTSKLELLPRIRRRILRRHEEDLRWMAHVYGIRFASIEGVDAEQMEGGGWEGLEERELGGHSLPDVVKPCREEARERLLYLLLNALAEGVVPKAKGKAREQAAKARKCEEKNERLQSRIASLKAELGQRRRPSWRFW